MSDVKILEIPSQTEGKEHYRVSIPIITPAHRRRMRMLQAFVEVKSYDDKYQEAQEDSKNWEDEMVAKAKETADRVSLLEDQIEAIEFSGNSDDLVVSYKNKVIKEKEYQREFEIKARKAIKKANKFIAEVDKERGKVQSYFGQLPGWELGEEHNTHLGIARDLLSHEPWAVAACCELYPDVWEDIGYEDWQKICKELLRRNPLFFRTAKQIMELQR